MRAFLEAEQGQQTSFEKGGEPRHRIKNKQSQIEPTHGAILCGVTKGPVSGADKKRSARPPPQAQQNDQQ